MLIHDKVSDIKSLACGEAFKYNYPQDRAARLRMASELLSPRKRLNEQLKEAGWNLRIVAQTNLVIARLNASVFDSCTQTRVQKALTFHTRWYKHRNPSPVEAAAYRVLGEALDNVAEIECDAQGAVNAIIDLINKHQAMTLRYV